MKMKPHIQLKFAIYHFIGEANTISAQTFSLVNAVFLHLRSKQVATLYNFPPSLSLPYPTQYSVAHYLLASTLVLYFLALI